MTGGVPEIEGFEDLEPLAQGGFSSVYRARQPSAGRSVAIKVLTATLDDETLPRFQRECQALGTVAAHPGICTLYSSGQTEDGHPYLVMELCDGTLGDRVRRDGPMAPEEAVASLATLADALAHAHARGIIHRDVKPDNVLVTQFGHLVLTDFGIARMEDGFHTTSGVVTASLAHAAPEVLDGGTPTEASDVWSLASTGYQLLTGTAPFRRTGEAASVMITRVFREAPPDLREAGIPVAVAEALEGAMAKDPAKRTPDMATFAAALRAALGRARSGGPAAVAEESAATEAEMTRPRRLAAGGGRPDEPPAAPRRLLWLAGTGFAALAVVGALVAGGVILGDDDAGGPATTTSSTSSSTVTTVAPVDERAAFCVSMRVDDEGLSIRTTPGLEAAGQRKDDDVDVIGAIPEGTCDVRDAAVEQEIQDVSGVPWRRIEWSGITGWVATGFLNPS